MPQLFRKRRRGRRSRGRMSLMMASSSSLDVTLVDQKNLSSMTSWRTNINLLKRKRYSSTCTVRTTWSSSTKGPSTFDPSSKSAKRLKMSKYSNSSCKTPIPLRATKDSRWCTLSSRRVSRVDLARKTNGITIATTKKEGITRGVTHKVETPQVEPTPTAQIALQ